MNFNPGISEKVTSIPLATGAATEATLQKILGFQIPVYDSIQLGYTGSNITTVQYFLGGLSGTLVATLTLGYDGSDNLISVVQS